jgi:molybdopterin biosynthesis enzyme
VRTLHAADGLAVLPDGVREIAEGELVDVMLIDDAPAAEPFRAV